MKEIALQLSQQFAQTSIEETLTFLNKQYKGNIAFSTSFGQEDQVISHYIFNSNLDIKVFTLDTGRLFEETYKVFEKTIQKYNKSIICYYPQKDLVEKMMSEKGPFSFYESVENRKECCNIRKVLPLKRALKDVKVWITGLRASQSDARKDLDLFQYDESFDLIKYNPLLYWSLEETMEFIKNNDIPYNKLFDQGFVSIGCQPCTRAIKPGEDFRAGRWWWEDNSKKECGLHAPEQLNTNLTINTKKIN
jgi:phosphoadenosine phosphosulfate reductase